MWRVHGDQRGLQPTEIGVALLLVALLGGVGFPIMAVLVDRAGEVGAQVEVRGALVPVRAGMTESPDIGVDELDAVVLPAPEGTGVHVAGVALERSPDGAVCIWRQAPSGDVFAVWESPDLTLYGRFDTRPDHCPDRAGARRMGFGG